MRILLIAAILATALVAPARAKDKVLEATMVPKTDATLKALSAVISASRERQAQIEDRAAAIQRQIDAIKAKVKNQKVEVGEQLSKEDLDAYNLLNTQLRYLKDAANIESFRQENLEIARQIYRASYFTATMMSEYVGDKGALDDDFEDFCRAKAKSYGMEIPVELLFTVQDEITSSDTGGKK